MLSAAHLADSQSALHKDVVAIVFPMKLERIFLPLRLFPSQDAHQFSRLNKPAMRSPMSKQTQEVFEKIGSLHSTTIYHSAYRKLFQFSWFLFFNFCLPPSTIIWMWEESYLSSHI